MCFECIDQNDVVLQVISKSDQNANIPVQDNHFYSFYLLINYLAFRQHITSGDAVVYVPLMGSGGGVGIVEIHGLHNEDMSDLKLYERPVAALRAMITAKDFR